MTRDRRALALAAVAVVAGCTVVRPVQRKLTQPQPPPVEVPPIPSDRPMDEADAFMVKHDLYPAANKLGRGFANTVGGWMEIPVTMQRYYVPNDSGTTLFTGLVVGVMRALMRTGVGIYETVTFLIPFPERFAPILPPLELPRMPVTPPTPTSTTPPSAPPQPYTQ